MIALKQATADQLVEVFMASDVDGSGVTGITSPTITINTDHGGFGAMNDGTWAEVGGGRYTVTFDATDSGTAGAIAIKIVKSGCLDYDDDGWVFAAAAYEATYGNGPFAPMEYGPFLRKYATEAYVEIPLYSPTTGELVSGAAFATADLKVSKGGLDFENVTPSQISEIGSSGVYTITLLALNLTIHRACFKLIDQSSPKIWRDTVFTVETYGHASAQHAFDLDSAGVELSTTGKAHVNAEVLDVLATDTHAEPAAIPTWPMSLRDMLKFLVAVVRHKKATTASAQTVYKDDAATPLGTKALSDDGTTFSDGKLT